MNTIALRLIGDVGWGLKLRVFVGAALSVLDLTTDIFITYTFLQEGKEMFFRSSVAMLGSSMFFMLLTVWGQNRELGLKKVVLEMIPVVTGLKPAADAFRVASGAKIEEGQKFDPLTEMVREFALSQRRRLILRDTSKSCIDFV